MPGCGAVERWNALRRFKNVTATMATAARKLQAPIAKAVRIVVTLPGRPWIACFSTIVS
jgi:hypothetical protein